MSLRFWKVLLLLFLFKVTFQKIYNPTPSISMQGLKKKIKQLPTAVFKHGKKFTKLTHQQSPQQMQINKQVTKILYSQQQTRQNELVQDYLESHRGINNIEFIQFAQVILLPNQPLLERRQIYLPYQTKTNEENQQLNKHMFYFVIMAIKQRIQEQKLVFNFLLQASNHQYLVVGKTENQQLLKGSLFSLNKIQRQIRKYKSSATLSGENKMSCQILKHFQFLKIAAQLLVVQVEKQLQSLDSSKISNTKTLSQNEKYQRQYLMQKVNLMHSEIMTQLFSIKLHKKDKERSILTFLLTFFQSIFAMEKRIIHKKQELKNKQLISSRQDKIKKMDVIYRQEMQQFIKEQRESVFKKMSIIAFVKLHYVHKNSKEIWLSLVGQQLVRLQGIIVALTLFNKLIIYSDKCPQSVIKVNRLIDVS